MPFVQQIFPDRVGKKQFESCFGFGISHLFLKTFTLLDGTMKKRKIYSGNFKARLVREWLQGKRSLLEIAEEHQVHPNQIKNWKSILLKRAHLVLSDQRLKNGQVPSRCITADDQ